jgi:hypothetical protein
LLHDVGRIVLASNLPKEYSAIVTAARQHGRILFDEESAQLGVTHAQVGAYLLGLWGMPAALVEAAALHHTPAQASPLEFSTLTAVHVANVFAHEKDLRKEGFSLPKLDIGYLNSISVMDQTEAWRRSLTADKSAPEKSKTAPLKMITPAAAAKATTPASANVVTAKSSSNARSFNWVGWVLAPTAAVAVLAVMLWWFGRSGSDHEVHARTRDTTAATNPAVNPKLSPGSSQAAATALNPATNAVVATRGFESLKVQAIFYRASNPSVMINGKTLEVGERINGVQIVGIAQTNVILAYGNERRSFPLQIK